MNEYALATIPTLGEVTEPPSLSKPKTFDQDAETYLRSQRQLFLNVNEMVSVLNPVALAVMTHAQSVAVQLSRVQEISTLAAQHKTDVAAYHNIVVEKADKVELLAQTVDTSKQAVEQIQEQLSQQADANLNGMSSILVECQKRLDDTVQHNQDTAAVLNEVSIIRDQVSHLLFQVQQAQQQALIVATEQLPETLVADIEADRRRARLHRTLNLQL